MDNKTKAAPTPNDLAEDNGLISRFVGVDGSEQQAEYWFAENMRRFARFLRPVNICDDDDRRIFAYRHTDGDGTETDQYVAEWSEPVESNPSKGTLGPFEAYVMGDDEPVIVDLRTFTVDRLWAQRSDACWEMGRLIDELIDSGNHK